MADGQASGSTRLWRVFFGVAPKNVFQQISPIRRFSPRLFDPSSGATPKPARGKLALPFPRLTAQEKYFVLSVRQLRLVSGDQLVGRCNLK
jgi:hypothetical protein